MDIKERLRRKAQNEQTSLELAELLRLDRLELDRLRRELAEAREWIAMVRESVRLGGEVVTFNEGEQERIDALLAALEVPK
jgi:uncharacterized membrane protein